MYSPALHAVMHAIEERQKHEQSSQLCQHYVANCSLPVPCYVVNLDVNLCAYVSSSSVLAEMLLNLDHESSSTAQSWLLQLRQMRSAHLSTLQ